MITQIDSDKIKKRIEPMADLLYKDMNLYESIVLMKAVTLTFDDLLQKGELF